MQVSLEQCRLEDLCSRSKCQRGTWDLSTSCTKSYFLTHHFNHAEISHMEKEGGDFTLDSIKL
uniref:Uncharacterized protein n=1 Tax=Anguilla anguilla TaxID=7936 RepID=A0A0E9WDC9_ANGAN